MFLSTPQLTVTCYRFQDGAVRGTYYGSTVHSDDSIDVIFEMDAGKQLVRSEDVLFVAIRRAEVPAKTLKASVYRPLKRL